MSRSVYGDAGPLRIEPAGSFCWAVVVLSLHALGFAGFLLAQLPWWIRLAGLLLIGLSLSWELRHRVPLLRGRGVRALVLDSAGRWTLETDDEQVSARLLPSSRVWPRIVFLHFDADGRRSWLVLPEDALNADDFRRLQLRLRLAANP